MDVCAQTYQLRAAGRNRLLVGPRCGASRTVPAPGDDWTTPC